MLTQGTKFAVKAAKNVWWKILAKKAAKTAGKVAKNKAAQEVAKMAAEKGTDILINKTFDAKAKTLDKKLKKLRKMLKKGNLDEAEYRQLRTRMIENADAAEL